MRVRADRRGHFAGRIACWWLRLAGYQTVVPRWRAVTGEIDLTAKRRCLLVFIEVKYQFDSQHITAPTTRQCQRIRSTASLFLARDTAFSDYQCWFGLFIVNHGKILPVCRIDYIKNAWQ
ncbi:MAG: YraN family protein [Candidatus Puniceispirillaceae bacterium]